MHFGAVQEFQGLNFTTDVRSESNIAALVGRNGAGKSRLLKAIAEQKVQVFVNDAPVPLGAARVLSLGDLAPGLISNYDPLQHREEQRQAVAVYNTHRGKFDVDPARSLANIGQSHMGRSHLNAHQVAPAISRIARRLGKDVNQLDDSDIGDLYSGMDSIAMGSLNIVGTVRAYIDRCDSNDQAEFRNHKYGEQNRHLTEDEFRARFGPPPWILLNEVLKTVLDDRYRFQEPVLTNLAGYEGKLVRISDGLVVDPNWLSSGEKVLMWLCLSMYVTTSGRGLEPPKLLLLDEPDSPLHPQMVQKLHLVLERIVKTFGCGIMFTTHSPTSVALFTAGPIWQVSERTIVEVDKDTAIADLLVGLDEILIHYARSKQVYVESHKDEDVYTELFAYLRRWNIGVSEHIALSFVPAAPKLVPDNVRKVLKANLGDLDPEKTESFIQALNGQGDCVQVEGAVKSLNADDGVPVHGIVDWDLTNQTHGRIHVLGQGLFYSLESAVLNPLTLGIYLLQNFRDRLSPADYGLEDAFDLVTLHSDARLWQAIADGVTRKALRVLEVRHEIDCLFLSGGRVSLDRRYVHMNGHDLESCLRSANAYPFLNAVNRRPGLLMDVLRKVVQATQGRTMPMAFVELFAAIQRAA